jgi:hypothetical protein
VCKDHLNNQIQLGYAEDLYVYDGEKLVAVITSRKSSVQQKVKLQFDDDGMNVYTENPLGGWNDDIYERLNNTDDVILLNCFGENRKLLHKLRDYNHKRQKILRRCFGKLGAYILYGMGEVRNEW